MRAMFTGFDSAWGAGNTGALSALVLQDDGALLLQEGEPSSATWNNAASRAAREAEGTLNIWAIDQPLCVANESGCRPVEADIARALMADFGCGAHSSNLRNPCWAADARIWDLLRTLTANNYGTERSTMIGDTTTGYIVTPHSERTALALAEVFRDQRNVAGPACAPPPGGKQPSAASMSTEDRTRPARTPAADRLPPEPSDEWAGPVTLRATGTTNLWRTSRGSVINPWMDSNRVVGWRLWVCFLEEDGEPAVLFVPFENQGRQQRGMRSAIQEMNRALWHALAADATRTNPIDFRILYRFEPV
jgi:hypothetical protein